MYYTGRLFLGEEFDDASFKYPYLPAECEVLV